MDCKQTNFKNKFLLIAIFVIVYFLVTVFLDLNSRLLEVSFLNIGQGDFCLIRTPNHHTIIVDGGPDPKTSLSKLSEKLPFYDRSIDLVILTHSHSDHLNGLIDIIKDFKVGAVLITGALADQEMYKTFLQTIQDKDIDLLFADSSKDFYFDDEVYLDILYPFTNQKNKKYKNINNSSVFFNLHYKENEILFTGDLEEDVHPFLAKYKDKLKTDILKLSHHGSKNGTTKLLLEKTKPSIGVLSYGLNNKFNHPHIEAVDLLDQFDIDICRTVDGDCIYKFE